MVVTNPELDTIFRVGYMSFGDLEARARPTESVRKVEIIIFDRDFKRKGIPAESNLDHAILNGSDDTSEFSLGKIENNDL